MVINELNLKSSLIVSNPLQDHPFQCFSSFKSCLCSFSFLLLSTRTTKPKEQQQPEVRGEEEAHRHPKNIEIYLPLPSLWTSFPSDPAAAASPPPLPRWITFAIKSNNKLTVNFSSRDAPIQPTYPPLPPCLLLGLKPNMEWTANEFPLHSTSCMATISRANAKAILEEL